MAKFKRNRKDNKKNKKKGFSLSAFFKSFWFKSIVAVAFVVALLSAIDKPAPYLVDADVECTLPGTPDWQVNGIWRSRLDIDSVEDQIWLSWTEAANSSFYTIEVSTDAGENWEFIHDADTGDPVPFYDPQHTLIVPDGAQIDIKITAHNDCGSGVSLEGNSVPEDAFGSYTLPTWILDKDTPTPTPTPTTQTTESDSPSNDSESESIRNYETRHSNNNNSSSAIISSPTPTAEPKETADPTPTPTPWYADFFNWVRPTLPPIGFSNSGAVTTPTPIQNSGGQDDTGDIRDGRSKTGLPVRPTRSLTR